MMIQTTTMRLSSSSLWIPLLLLLFPTLTTEAFQFNYEVERRVYERIDDFMNTPIQIVNSLYRFLHNDYFHQMDYLDRDSFQHISFSLLKEYKVSWVYYGTETGMWAGYNSDNFATYREPGTSYPTTASTNGSNPSSVMEQRYLKACVDPISGRTKNCTHATKGNKYIKCVNDCSYTLCPDEATQNCKDGVAICELKQKWCPNYQVMTVRDDDIGRLGFVPRTDHCINEYGAISEEQGAILKKGDSMGMCTYQDGHTLVKRKGTQVGDYFYCQKKATRIWGKGPPSSVTVSCRPDDHDNDDDNKNCTIATTFNNHNNINNAPGTSDSSSHYVCDDVFEGAFVTRDYDPRYRPWYSQKKQHQKASWTKPYPFFKDAALGISYGRPFYIQDDSPGQQKRPGLLFAGVLGTDFEIRHVTSFLEQTYPPTTTTTTTTTKTTTTTTNIKNTASDVSHTTTTTTGTFIVIYETEEPNYLIAASTGRRFSKKVMLEDETLPCGLEQDVTKCTVKRISMEEIGFEPYDDVLMSAYTAHKKELEEVDNGNGAAVSGGGLVPSFTDTTAYVSQTSFYSSGDELNWTILIISSVERSTTDALTHGDALFTVVCIISCLGFVLCMSMFGFMYTKRKTRAVILADWRFTLAFLLGCALLNLSSMAMLGENTQQLCMLRMWSFPLFFSLALSPLFVKVYRMYKLVGTAEQAPAVISNPMAVAMTMPIVLIQVVILVIFSIVDPAEPVSVVAIDEAAVMEVVECTQESSAYSYTVLVYQGLLVVIGCVLAFLTRNLNSSIGQAKELILSMYNIFFVGLVTVVIFAFVDVDASGEAVLVTTGVFCGTVFSSAAFVLPRINTGQSILRGVTERFSSVKAKSGRKDSTQTKKPSSNKKLNVNKDETGASKGVSFADNTGWSAMGSAMASTPFNNDKESKDEAGAMASARDLYNSNNKNDNQLLGSIEKDAGIEKPVVVPADPFDESLPAFSGVSGWSAMEDAEDRSDAGSELSKEFHSTFQRQKKQEEQCHQPQEETSNPREQYMDLVKQNSESGLSV